MSAVQVKNLVKYYQVHQKEPGLLESIRSLINRRYEDVKAVDNISFQINDGELVGFIGPNGAGKTTTLKILSGLLYPTSGFVSVLGSTPWQRKADYLKQMSLVMGQKNQLWWDLPAMETFILNREIYEIPQEEFKQTLAELTDLLEVGGILKVQVRKLSLGQRMKCELIAALLHRPKVLFLDEPTIGLDVVMQKRMRDFIEEYNRRYKATILLTSHYMEDVKELCRRVLVINQGRILFDGALAEIVDRYADHKRLEVIFAKDIDPKKLETVGEVRKFSFPRAVISVSRKDASMAAAKLLETFPVKDLNIEEPRIEDIIRELFSGQDVA